MFCAVFFSSPFFAPGQKKHQIFNGYKNIYFHEWKLNTGNSEYKTPQQVIIIITKNYITMSWTLAWVLYIHYLVLTTNLEDSYYCYSSLQTSHRWFKLLLKGHIGKRPRQFVSRTCARNHSFIWYLEDNLEEMHAVPGR